MNHLEKFEVEKFEDFKNKKEINILDIFDIDNCPMSELDKAYIDYEPLCYTVDWFSVDDDDMYDDKSY